MHLSSRRVLPYIFLLFHSVELGLSMQAFLQHANILASMAIPKTENIGSDFLVVLLVQGETRMHSLEASAALQDIDQLHFDTVNLVSSFALFGDSSFPQEYVSVEVKML